MDFKKRGKKHHETIYIYYIYTHNLDIFIKKKMQLVTRGKKHKTIYIYIYIRETLILWPKFKSIFFVFFPRLNRENVKNDT